MESIQAFVYILQKTYKEAFVYMFYKKSLKNTLFHAYKNCKYYYIYILFIYILYFIIIYYLIFYFF